MKKYRTIIKVVTVYFLFVFFVDFFQFGSLFRRVFEFISWKASAFQTTELNISTNKDPVPKPTFPPPPEDPEGENAG